MFDDIPLTSWYIWDDLIENEVVNGNLLASHTSNSEVYNYCPVSSCSGEGRGGGGGGVLNPYSGQI